MEELIKLKKQVNGIPKKNQSERREAYREFNAAVRNTLATLKTPKLFKKVRLPDHISVRNLENNPEVYEGCSRWFMQMGFDTLLTRLIDLKIAYPEGKKFLDVGSGTGNMVSLANELGLEGYGIEGSKVLIDLIPELNNLNVYNQDFFTFDKYNEFDLIYMWNPNPPRMNELAKLVMNQINKKTAIVGLIESAFGNPLGAISKGEVKKPWKVKDKVILFDK